MAQSTIVEVTEQKRLNEAREVGIPWKKWGPYLIERQWGRVREDYSERAITAKMSKSTTSTSTANPLLHAVPLQISPKGISLPGTDRDEPATVAGGVRGIFNLDRGACFSAFTPY